MATRRRLLVIRNYVHDRARSSDTPVTVAGEVYRNGRTTHLNLVPAHNVDQQNGDVWIEDCQLLARLGGTTIRLAGNET